MPVAVVSRVHFHEVELVSSVDRYDAGFLLDDPTFARALQRADELIETLDPADIPGLFDQIPIDIFALLALHRPDRWPRLARWLPLVPPEETQVGSIGSSGQQAFLEAAAFVRTIETTLQTLGRDPNGLKFLDYGIFWGRLSRLLYKYTATSNLYGVDAWVPSLEAARSLGFRGHLSPVDAAPTTVPFDVKFDVVFAFSILTHVSEISANAIGEAVATALQSKGLFIFTVRPAAYAGLMMSDAKAHAEAFAQRGFGHTPDQWAIDSGVPHYGNTTISPDYFRAHWPAFEVLNTTVNAIDPFQVIVVLQKR
jgi:hypothetical protein